MVTADGESPNRSEDATQQRLALLVRAGEMFHRSLRVDETLENVARMAVESFADICLFDLVDERSERLYVTAGAHRDTTMEPLLKQLGSAILYQAARGKTHPAVEVTQTGKPFLLQFSDDAAIEAHATSPQHADFMRRMGYRSKIVVPVLAQAKVFGALTFVRGPRMTPFDPDDVRAAEELGRRAGLAIANADEFRRQQRVASTLQSGSKRLGLLVRAGEMFHRSLEVEETLENVARMAVESFADICLFDLIDERSERLYVTAGAHRDAAMEPLLKRLGSALLYETGSGKVHPAVQVTETGEPFFLQLPDEHAIAAHATSPQHADFMRRMGYRSKIVVPVVAQGEIFGALTFVRGPRMEPFDTDDVQAAEELGRRAGLAIANAKQFHREQHVASTLQRAFLSERFPQKPGLAFHAYYSPGDDEAELGGDWYDAFEIADGSVIFTIGDITGKGVEAARLMVQLRQSVRIAATFSRDPGEILRMMNEALLFERSDALATAFVGTIAPDARTFRFASAGHPPAFLRWQRRPLQLLATGSPPLGISTELRFPSQAVSLDREALLVLYTDGLSEATRDAIAGERMIRGVVENEAIAHAANPARYLLRAVSNEPLRDDVAIMTIRFGADQRRWRVDVGDPSAGYVMKRDLLAAIAQISEPALSDLHACELIFGELIANAVRHAPGPLSISLTVERDDVVLHVIDEGPGFELKPTLPEDLWSESGRGLFLVSALGRRLDVERLPGYGSYIRVVLPVTRRAMRRAEALAC